MVKALLLAEISKKEKEREETIKARVPDVRPSSPVKEDRI
jgi:hypothetical protein